MDTLCAVGHVADVVAVVVIRLVPAFVPHLGQRRSASSSSFVFDDETITSSMTIASGSALFLTRLRNSSFLKASSVDTNTNDTTVARVKARQGKKISGSYWFLPRPQVIPRTHPRHATPLPGRRTKRTHMIAWQPIEITQTSILAGCPFVTPWRSIRAGRSPVSTNPNESTPRIKPELK